MEFRKLFIEFAGRYYHTETPQCSFEYDSFKGRKMLPS